jgi:hypothetical protein
MPYSNWLKYGYRLLPEAAGHIEIKKSRSSRSCDGMARNSLPEEDWGTPFAWDHVGQETSPECQQIQSGDTYLIQTTYENDLSESFIRECCTTCAISYGFIEKTRS